MRKAFVPSWGRSSHNPVFLSPSIFRVCRNIRAGLNSARRSISRITFARSFGFRSSKNSKTGLRPFAFSYSSISHTTTPYHIRYILYKKTRSSWTFLGYASVCMCWVKPQIFCSNSSHRSPHASSRCVVFREIAAFRKLINKAVSPLPVPC